MKKKLLMVVVGLGLAVGILGTPALRADDKKTDDKKSTTKKTPKSTKKAPKKTTEKKS